MNSITAEINEIAYKCEEIMLRIGKQSLLVDWMEEEDLCLSEKHSKIFWENKLKEALAAERTYNLTPEQLVEHKKSIMELRSKLEKLTYEAGCANVIHWDEMLQESEFCADEAFYWNKKIVLMENVVTGKLRRSNM